MVFKIYDTENFEITNHILKIELYTVGLYGNQFTEFEVKENDLKLTTVETFNMGAGGQTSITYDNKTKIAIITNTNTMTEEMKTEQEKIKLNYKKSTYFSKIDVNALTSEIYDQSEK